MNLGHLTLTSLVTELKRIASTKHDFICDLRTLDFSPNTDDIPDSQSPIQLTTSDPQVGEWIPDTPNISWPALPQMGNRVDPNIPAKFIRELATKSPSTCAILLNEMASFTANPRTFFRCVDGYVRACLSPNYGVFDNLDVITTTFEVAEALGALPISGSLTPTRMHLTLIETDVFDQIKSRRDAGENHVFFNPERKKVYHPALDDLPGDEDTIFPCFRISNSETGHGGTNITMGFFDRCCVNLCLMEKVVTQIHLGKEMSEDGIFSPETRTLDAQAKLSKLRDSIRTCFTPERFRKLVARINGAKSDPITAPTAALDNVVARTDIPVTERDRILEYFLNEYTSDRFGLSQAVSRAAQDFDDPDRSTQFETIAGDIINQPSLVTA